MEYHPAHGPSRPRRVGVRREFLVISASLPCCITARMNATTKPPKSGGPVDPSAIADLVAANHILADQGVLDGFGHVSARHPNAPERYFLSRSKAPAIIAAPPRAASPRRLERVLNISKSPL